MPTFGIWTDTHSKTEELHNCPHMSSSALLPSLRAAASLALTIHAALTLSSPDPLCTTPASSIPIRVSKQDTSSCTTAASPSSPRGCHMRSHASTGSIPLSASVSSAPRLARRANGRQPAQLSTREASISVVDLEAILGAFCLSPLLANSLHTGTCAQHHPFQHQRAGEGGWVSKGHVCSGADRPPTWNRIRGYMPDEARISLLVAKKGSLRLRIKRGQGH